MHSGNIYFLLPSGQSVEKDGKMEGKETIAARAPVLCLPPSVSITLEGKERKGRREQGKAETALPCLLPAHTILPSYRLHHAVPAHYTMKICLLPTPSPPPPPPHCWLWAWAWVETDSAFPGFCLLLPTACLPCCLLPCLEGEEKVPSPPPLTACPYPT